MTSAKPRLQVLRHEGWSFINSVTQVKRVHPGWSAPANGAISLGSGTMRGDFAQGQYLVSPNLSFALTGPGHGGYWDTVGVTWDCSYSSTLTVTILDVVLASGGPIRVSILSPDASRGFWRVQNIATGEAWVSTINITPVSSQKIGKVEFLCYAQGGTKGYFSLRVEGVEQVAAYGVNLTNVGGVDTTIGGLTWTNLDMAEPIIRVGIGGWTQGDVISDTAGNPRVLGFRVNADGHYQDGTGSAGGPHYLLLDEAIANTTDNVSLPASGTVRESYLFEDLPGTISSVLALSAQFFAKTDVAGQQLPIAFVRANPDITTGIDFSYAEPQGSSYSSSTTFDQWFGGWWRKNPATGRPWTVADVNSLEVGWYRSTALGGLSYVSHVSVEVACYKSPPAAAVAQTTQNALLLHKTHRYARLWQLWPIWGCPLFFTDHNAPLVVDGVTYVPSGGFSETDQRRELGLKDANVDISGAISSAAITTNDLRAGRFSGARLIQSLVDWRYPWAGTFERRVWRIEPTEWDSEVWTAEASGMQVRLQDRAGDAHYPLCRYNLFDNDYALPGSRRTWETGCKLDSLAFYRTFDVTGAITDRRVFVVTVNGSPSLPAGWYTNGLICFVTGPNRGFVSEIRSQSGGTISLHLPLPFDVSSLESGMIWPGCNFLKGRPSGTAGDCYDKYNNVPNWGGDDLIPGTDEAMRATSL